MKTARRLFSFFTFLGIGLALGLFKERQLPSLNVSEFGRFLIDNESNAADWALDLPGDSDRNRNLSIYYAHGEEKNDHQMFVLIPADDGAYFICNKQNGCVLAANAKSGLVVGIHQFDSPLDASLYQICWCLDKSEKEGCFQIRVKGIEKYIGSPAMVKDSDVKLSSKVDALNFRWNPSKMSESQTLLPSSKRYFLTGETLKVQDPPIPTSFEVSAYDEVTKPVCTQERLIPYFLANDSRLITTWKDRIVEQPVYRIRVFEWWERDHIRDWHGNSTEVGRILESEEVRLYSSRIEQFEEDSRSWVLNLPLSGSVSVDAVLLPSGIIPTKGSASLGVSGVTSWASKSTKHRLVSEERRDEISKKEKEVTVTYRETHHRVLYASWLKRKKVVLERVLESGHAEEVSSNTVIDPSNQKSYTFPTTMLSK